MKNIYFTTPIYYASGNPHLGHAYTTILTDCFVKYYDLLGYNTRFVTGTDEHGLKIERVAEKNNEKPEELVEKLAKNFENTWKDLNIVYDDFIRTTEARHKDVVKDIWIRMMDKGDIYLGNYEGMYCVDCERFFTQSELLEGNICPVHGRKVETMTEETYFFKMSKYQDRLIKYIEEHPEFIQPVARKNEVLGFLQNQELKDLSISRTTFTWGIPVPGDEKHVMYVWIDALANYISSLGGIGTDLYKEFWNNTVHIIGKDILRFHAVYWPCMLFSIEEELPKNIIVHGWWTISNKKISKSDPATKVDPIELTKDIGCDALRYFLLRELVLGRDGDIDWSHLIASINNGLANNVGNLVNRTVSMVNKYLGGKVHRISKTQNEFDCEVEMRAKDMIEIIKSEMERFNPSMAVSSIMDYCDVLNGYLDKTLPWSLAKDEANRERLNEIFSYLLEGIQWISNVLYPFVPEIAASIKKQICCDKEFIMPAEFILDHKEVVEKTDIIFRRITKDEEKSFIDKWQNN